MNLTIGQAISIRLRNVKEAPYTVLGKYMGAGQLSENGQSYVIVEGQVGDNIGKLIHVPEPLIHTITEL